VPDAVLREIEKTYQEDDAKLNTGFNNFDDCSRRSIFVRPFNNILKLCKIFIVYDDECQTASEIYKCGLEKEPNVTNNVFNQNKGNATIVANFSHF